MHRRTFGTGLGGLALAAAEHRRAAAQTEGRWPSREISLVTGFGPGAGTDLIARALAAHMEKTLGVSVIVRNTPGAGGTLGPGRVAQSRPDGYTFGMVAASAVLVAPLTMDLPYKPWESFDFLAGTSELRISHRRRAILARCAHAWRISSRQDGGGGSPSPPPTPAPPCPSSTWRG